MFYSYPIFTQKAVKGRGNLTRGARRSQRQIDKEMKEEAERIKKENQALLQKEREQMKSSSSTTSSVTEEGIDEVDKLNISQESGDLNKPDPEKSQIAEVNFVSSQSQASNRYETPWSIQISIVLSLFKSDQR